MCASNFLPPIPQLMPTPSPALNLKRPGTHQLDSLRATTAKRQRLFENQNTRKRQICKQNDYINEVQIPQRGQEQLDVLKQAYGVLNLLNSNEKQKESDSVVQKELLKTREMIWEVLKQEFQSEMMQEVFSNSCMLAKDGTMYKLTAIDPEQLQSFPNCLPGLTADNEDNHNHNNNNLIGTQIKDKAIADDNNKGLNFNISPLYLPHSQRPASAPQPNQAEAHMHTTVGGGVIAQGIIEYNHTNVKSAINFTKHHMPNFNTTANKHVVTPNMLKPVHVENFCSQDGSSGGPQQPFLEGMTVTGTPANDKVINNVNHRNYIVSNVPEKDVVNVNNVNAYSKVVGTDVQQDKKSDGNDKDSVQIDLRTLNGGQPMTLTLPPGQQMDESVLKVVTQLMSQGQVQSMQISKK
eukprot:TRINITY_DN31255_c0_g1_i2.p1 TRINITY_DN31255_c0_g1~~TRINITY_DN31255_c0_g1_i2.p1  ORF type:complete len:408 (+),score=43.54 TRINITY_DN31255_c0_g1_i2:1-1224(+)